MVQTQSSVIATDAERRGFWGKVVQGDFGLPQTYWLYWVAAGGIVNFIANFLTSAEATGILLFAFTVYAVPVILGVWRAANKYQGPVVWAVLARMSLAMGVVGLVLVLLVTIS